MTDWSVSSSSMSEPSGTPITPTTSSAGAGTVASILFMAPARRPNQPDAGLSTQHIAAPPRASMPDVRSSQPTHWDKQAGAPVQPPNQPESGAITEHISPHNPQAVSKDSEPERQQASTQQLPIEPDTSTSKDSDSAFREGATE